MKAIQKIQELQKALDEKLRSFGQEQFFPIFEEFFKAYPGVEYIHWKQYTPYFNDGDACVFRVDDAGILLSEEMAKDYCKKADEDYNEVDASEDPDYGNPRYIEEATYNGEFPKLKEAWGSIPESLFLAAFGDHVQVTVKRDGTVNVEDYDHD